MDGIIITAGLSSRMGKFKPLLKYNGLTFLENIISKLDLICSKIIVVTGHNSDKIIENISLLSNDIKSKIKIVNNKNYEKGMFTSLQKGLENCNSNWVLYHFVDQPNLPEQFYKQFIDKIGNNYNWIQPINNERKGHPILFNKQVQKLIIESNENSNLREISKNVKLKKKYWECDFEEIFTDIDTINDFNKL